MPSWKRRSRNWKRRSPENDIVEAVSVENDSNENKKTLVLPETPTKKTLIKDEEPLDLDFSGSLLKDDEDFKTARQKKQEDQFLPPQIANAIPGYKLIIKLGGERWVPYIKVCKSRWKEKWR